MLAKLIDDHRVFDSMEDVVVIDSVAARRRVDLHTPILYYERWLRSTAFDAGEDDVCAVAAMGVCDIENDFGRARRAALPRCVARGPAIACHARYEPRSSGTDLARQARQRRTE